MMATHATPLLSDFDFNVTSSASTLQSSPPLFDPYHRPPTPDPRYSHTSHTQRKPRDLFYRPTSPATSERRLRRRPTAIHVGAANSKTHAAPPTSSSDGDLPFLQSTSPQPAFTSLAPLLPSTASPHLPATSPSLSSSGTTVQSSPTLTPTGALQGAHGVQHDDLGHWGVSEEWRTQRKYGLKRAKRLPHRDFQDLWEVHAIVHLGESSSERHQARQAQQEVRTRSVESIPDPTSHLAPASPEIETRNQGFSEVEEQFASSLPLRRRTRAVRFQGVKSESASRENSLKKVQKEESSTYSLSKYQFPAPPDHYLVGTFGYLHSPTQIHYRGASFDLVNPHASLLLEPPNFETPAEIDGLLDGYFETSSPTPTTMLYGDADTARRNILKLDSASDSPPISPPGQRQLPAPPSPSQSERSDPFGPGMSDDESQAAVNQQDTHNSGQDSTYDALLANYDYTREGSVPAIHQSTLHALEGKDDSDGGSSTLAYLATLAAAKDAHPELPLHVALSNYREEMASRPRDSVTQSRAATAMQRDIKTYQRTSEVPTSDRTYGDTNQLLNIPPRTLNAILAEHDDTPEEQLPQIRPAPVRSLTEQSTISVGPGPRSAQGSLHDQGSDESMKASPPNLRNMAPLGFDFGFPEQRRAFPAGEPGLPGRRESIFADQGDWHTEPSESMNDLGIARMSEESYANTSHYSEGNRLSTMTHTVAAVRASGDTIQPVVEYKYVVAEERAADCVAFEDDVDRATNYLLRVYKDKTLDQDLEEHLVTGVPSRTTHRQRRLDRMYLQDLRGDAISSDLELEKLRKKNPAAFSVAVDRVAASLRPHTEASRTRLDRFVDIFRKGPREQRQSSAIMEETLGENDERGLLSSTTVSDGRRSELAWSDSNHTFRTVRDSASIIGGRTGLDIGERQKVAPWEITSPPVAMTSGNRQGRADPQSGADIMRKPQHHGKGKVKSIPLYSAAEVARENVEMAPLQRRNYDRPVRRAAISSQTTLRPLQISGSPTSNIQGAFTDSEMLQASTNWNMRSQRRVEGNLHNLGFLSSPSHQESYPGDQGRLLVVPSQRMDTRTMELQLKWSEDFLFRCTWCPVTCFLFYSGSFDWWIAKKSDGRIKEMAPRKKKEAFHQMFLCSIIWAIMMVVAIIIWVINK